MIFIAVASCNPRLANGLRKNDLKRDVEMVTDKGSLVIRLSDSTPLHRDNFLRLVKEHFYDSISFHRVINEFMVQAGDPDTKPFKSVSDTNRAAQTIPAEIRPGLFHKKGVIAAARRADDVNPQKASSATQFYLVQGKIFTEQSLDSVETFRIKKKLPEAHRQVYKTQGGTPHLDQQYTVFGEVIRGLQVIDSIAVTRTNGPSGGNRPLNDVKILKARLVKRT
jgi:peptidyl-prolyl cis-trans isomerase B (cyclophilin B)